MGIADRTDDPLSHRLFIGSESRVNRGDDIVECRKNLVGEIEIPLLENVALRSREEAEARLLEFLGSIQLTDLAYLLGKA